MASFNWPPIGSGNAFTSIELDGATSGSLTLTVPAIVSTYTLVFPAAQGGSGQTLVNDGSGNLSWNDAAAITIGAFGSSPNANGLTLTGDVLNMEPADATHPGGLSAATFNAFTAKVDRSGDTMTGTLDIDATSSDFTPLIVKGVTGNSSNIQEWWVNGGAVAYQKSDGTFNFTSGAGITINSGPEGQAPISIIGDSNTWNYAFGVFDGGNNPLFTIGIDGSFVFTGSINWENGARIENGGGTDFQFVLTSGNRLIEDFSALTTSRTVSFQDADGTMAYLTDITSPPLTSAHILVGNGSNVAADVAMSGAIAIDNTGATSYSGTVPINKGGTGQTTQSAGFDALSPMTTGGDLIYGGASGVATRLANGSAGNVLTSAGGTSAPTWAPPATNGTVTSVTFTGDGTVLSSTPSSAVTTTGTVTAALANASAATYLGGPQTGSAAAPTYKSFTAPTRQNLTSTGATAGYIFTISTSTTCAVGDTYTNNSNTYTVVSALSAQSGQVMVMSGASAPTASGTLTRSAGAGTSSVTFSAALALAAYTTPTSPRNPIALNLKMVAGGGGGGAGGTTGGTAGTTGGQTIFAGNGVLLIANGGTFGGNTGGAGTGGTATVAGANASGVGISGSGGVGGINEGTSPTTGCPGTPGANSFFGGAAFAPLSGGTQGGAAATNSGSGGGGGSGTAVSNSNAGSSGGAGGFIDALVTTLQATYYYTIGAGGAGQLIGTGVSAGGAGGSGLILVGEQYQ